MTNQSTNTTPDRATDNQPTVNERLYKIIRKLCHDFENPKVDSLQAQVDAKQAINSLFKELVAEAKPLLKERTASTEFTTWDGKTKVVKTFESETDQGFNKAINEFEQNLLKALRKYEQEDNVLRNR